MFCSFKFTKKVFAVMCTCFLIGLAAGGFGIHKAVTAVQADKELEQGIQLPIIMYHGVLKDTKRQGKYVISPELLESDMKYLKENGYTPVFMQDVIDYVKNGTPLPEKPIILSFDDGYYNNYAYAFPLAQQYDMKLVIAPIIAKTEEYSKANEENANYGHITWDNMKRWWIRGMWKFKTIRMSYIQVINSKLASRKEKENPKVIIRRVLHKIYKQHKIASQSISEQLRLHLYIRLVLFPIQRNPIFAVWVFRLLLYVKAAPTS